MCDKLQTHIQGRVLSSLELRPVVLAAIMIGTEVATFTDENGVFSFDISTSNGDITLLFQETHHRVLKIVVNIRHSKSPEINIVLEYIQTTVAIHKVQLGSDVTLSSERMEGVSVNLTIPPQSLVDPDTKAVYEGTGQLLYSLYNADNQPDFTSEALNRMIYTDSKGAEFSIQSYVICSMEIAGESGDLALRKGQAMVIKMTLKFDMNIVGSQVSNLHLYAYSKTRSRWLDSGKIGITSIEKRDDEYGTIVAIHQTLREITYLWAIGHPVKITCYVKAMVTNQHTRKELLDTTLSLVQFDTSLNRRSYYQHSALTTRGIGVCLKAVCMLGGTVRVLVSKSDRIIAVPPSVDVGMVMGDKEQIVFYYTQDLNTQTPYYHTEKDCQSSEKPYFEFTSNQPVRSTYSQPTIFPLVKQENLSLFRVNRRDVYCFVKVSVYDCAPITEMKVLSYSPLEHNQLLSMHTAVAVGADDTNTCGSTEVVRLRASCVEFTCHSDVHVTVQSQNHYNTYSQESPLSSSAERWVDCRYWSSNGNIPIDHQPSETMKSFHLSDKETLPPSSGVYRSYNTNLALLQCMSGTVEAPASVMDPEAGVAVTFTCLF